MYPACPFSAVSAVSALWSSPKLPVLPTTPALARSAANSQLGLERVGKTLVPGVIRAGQWVDVADPSHGEERGEGCCVSACLSAHPWRATPPPRQPHGEERGERCRVSACLAAHPWRATPPPRQPKLNSTLTTERSSGGRAALVRSMAIGLLKRAHSTPSRGSHSPGEVNIVGERMLKPDSPHEPYKLTC